MSAVKVARYERHRYEMQLRKHLKGCLACTRARADAYAEPCDDGSRLAEAVSLMDRQIELLTPPPQPEYVQDALF